MLVMPALLEKIAAFNWKYLAVGAAVVLVGGYVVFGRGAALGPTLTIAPGDFRQEVSVSGTVIAARSADLGFAANGRIIGTYATVGQHVAAGTILAETENADLVATVSQKEADLASLLAGMRPEQVAVAQAAVGNAEAALADSITSAYTAADDAVHNKTDAFFTNPRVAPKFVFIVTDAGVETSVENERLALEQALQAWSVLADGVTANNAALALPMVQGYQAKVVQYLADLNGALNKAVPDQTTSAAALSADAATLATARTNVNTAATALTTAASALTSAEKTLDLDQAGPTSADIAAAQAQLQNAKALLAKTRVVAPFGGVVTRMDAKVGEIVSPTTSEISMQSDGTFQIETYIPEVSIANVALEDPATTTLDAYGSSVEFPSLVVLVDPAETVKDGVPTYKTTLVFAKPDPRIRSGMTANVIIETGVLHGAIVIPTGAIGLDSTGTYVSVVNGKSAEKRYVTTGGSPALGETLITAGLSAGDVILLSPR